MWFIVYWACLASAAVYILAHFVVDIWCAVLPNRDFSFNPLMQQHIKLIVKPRPFRCNNNTIKITLRIYCKWKLAILIVLFCFLHSGLLLYKTFICKCVLIREHYHFHPCFPSISSFLIFLQGNNFLRLHILSWCQLDYAELYGQLSSIDRCSAALEMHTWLVSGSQQQRRRESACCQL